jgi:hypothetical protein
MTRSDQRSRKLFLGGLVVAALALLSSFVFTLLTGPPDAVHAQESAVGGDIIPLRQVSDPYPVFNGIAIDTENNLVAMTDVNRKSLMSYPRSAGSQSRGITASQHQIFGPLTNVGFVAGIALDSQRKEILAVNNDIEDTMIVLPYDAQGNAAPSHMLAIPHQAWGVALSRTHDEIAITVEIQEAVIVYKRDAKGVEAPMRVIRGPSAGLADPHGIIWNDRRNEITVANHGNYRGLVKDVGGGCVPTGNAEPEAGAVLPPSITTYSGDAKGDAKPLRVIQGENTRLDFPMGLSDDIANDEFAVANNGDNSVLIFSRTANGNATPVRILGGPNTGINRPMGVVIDPVNNELWVSNFVDHWRWCSTAKRAATPRPSALYARLRPVRQPPDSGIPRPLLTIPSAIRFWFPIEWPSRASRRSPGRRTGPWLLSA